MPCERYSFSLSSRRVGVSVSVAGEEGVWFLIFEAGFFFVLNIEEMKLIFSFSAGFGNVEKRR